MIKILIVLLLLVVGMARSTFAISVHHSGLVLARSASVIVNGCGGTVIYSPQTHPLAMGILTAAHCVTVSNLTDPLNRETAKIGERIKLSDDVKAPAYFAHVIRVNAGLDLALLDMPSALVTYVVPVALATDRPQIGDDLWFIGDPYNNHDATGKAYLSEIDNKFVFNGCGHAARWGGTPHQAYGLGGEKIRPGNSGGGLFNDDGQLVGVVVGHSVNQDCEGGEEGITPLYLWGLAVGLDTVQDFLR